MTLTTIIGFIAAAASTVSFAPQAWKIIKSRKTDDISLVMYVVTVTGFALWTAYGILLNEWPLIVTNIICFVMAGFILLMKILPPRQKNTVADAIDPEAG